MKIFGVGLSRTGTSSLTIALRHLGYNIIHGPQPFLLPGLKETIMNCDGATDFPIAIQYKELDKLFPNSKFILTTRSLRSWLKSVEIFLKYTGVHAHDSLRILLYGDCNFNYKKYRNTFLKHNSEVIKYFKGRKNFLIMDFSKGCGWNSLCKFLNKKIPKIPFPHEFTSDEVIRIWGKK